MITPRTSRGRGVIFVGLATVAAPSADTHQPTLAPDQRSRAGPALAVRRASARLARGSLANAAVDPLAEQVGVTEVTGVLLDHVEYYLAQREGGAVLHRAVDGQVGRAGDELLCEGDLLPPGPPGVGHHCRISHRPRPVSVLGIIRPVQRRRVGPRHYPPEPVALHVGHMADQAAQGHSG